MCYWTKFVFPVTLEYIRNLCDINLTSMIDSTVTLNCLNQSPATVREIGEL